MAMAFYIQMNQSTLAGSSTNNNNFSVLGHVVSVQHICDIYEGRVEDGDGVTGRQDGMAPGFPSLPPTSSGNDTPRHSTRFGIHWGCPTRLAVFRYRTPFSAGKQWQIPLDLGCQAGWVVGLMTMEAVWKRASSDDIRADLPDLPEDAKPSRTSGDHMFGRRYPWHSDNPECLPMQRRGQGSVFTAVDINGII